MKRVVSFLLLFALVAVSHVNAGQPNYLERPGELSPSRLTDIKVIKWDISAKKLEANLQITEGPLVKVEIMDRLGDGFIDDVSLNLEEGGIKYHFSKLKLDTGTEWISRLNTPLLEITKRDILGGLSSNIAVEYSAKNPTALLNLMTKDYITHFLNVESLMMSLWDDYQSLYSEKSKP